MNCTICNIPIANADQRCNNCWEVEHRLKKYLSYEAGRANAFEIIGTCSTCAWYDSDWIKHDSGYMCSCPKMDYGYGKKNEDPSAVMIEDDEGWGMLPGPDFMCKHHKVKDVTDSQPRSL